MARFGGRALADGDAGRDAGLEALVVDRYLETLLSRAPVVDPLIGVPAELRGAAEALRAGLPRHHPSFRFEEELGARLLAVAEGRTGIIVAFPGPVPGPLDRGSSPAPDPRRVAPSRPVVLGGVLTSAALSIAGAAYVAWRRHRASTGVMPRAVRAVARARTV